MDISQLAQSPFYKGADFPAPRVLTIQAFSMETVPDGVKPALSFLGETKKLILNKTRINELTPLIGSETDAWAGKAIECYTLPGQRPDGQPAQSIHVRLPQQPTTSSAVEPAAAPPNNWGQ